MSEVSEIKDENMQLEKLVRLISNIRIPQFLPGGVPISVAAAVYGKDPCFVRQGIRDGWLPIGHCKPGEQRDNFYISPYKLWQDTGFVYTGQKPEEIYETKKRGIPL